MGTDYCPDHERYFDSADGCPDCDEQEETLERVEARKKLLRDYIKGK